MYNLSDLQVNLKTLIKQIRGIQQSLRQPLTFTKMNQNKMVIKIPTIILLAKICPYLNMRDVNYLSTVCRSLRKKIYSPLGWRLFLIQKTPYPITVIEFEKMGGLKKKKVSFDEYYHETDDFDDEKYIEKEQSKFKKILLKKFEDYQKSKEKHDALLEKVKVQNSSILKMKHQFIFFQQIRGKLKEENDSHKEKLKKLSEGFSKKIQEMDDQSEQLNKERTKLQNQKEALAGKIREYQHEIQLVREDSEKSKQILKRLKNYLLYKEL